MIPFHILIFVFIVCGNFASICNAKTLFFIFLIFIFFSAFGALLPPNGRFNGEVTFASIDDSEYGDGYTLIGQWCIVDDETDELVKLDVPAWSTLWRF